MPENDYYEVLGIQKAAAKKEIKEAYRSLAFQYHPDRNGSDKSSAEMMKRVNEAYAVLSDPKKRREYDNLRAHFGTNAHRHFRQNYSDQDIFRDSDIRRVFEEMSRQSGFRGFEEVFKSFYGPEFKHFEFRRPGVFGKGFIFTGRFDPLGGNRSGKTPLSGGKPGSGLLGKMLTGIWRKSLGKHLPQQGDDVTETVLLSPEMGRTGGPYAYSHPKNGKKLVVKIPAGVRDGQRIRLKGQGGPGKNGAPAGDLFLKVHIRISLAEKIKGWVGKVAKRIS